jgi:hypothetical protein
LVLILHTLLIFALLRFMVRQQNSALRMVPETQLFEMIVNTTRLPEPRMRKEIPKPAPTHAPVQPVPQISPLAEPLPPTVPTPAPDIRGFGQILVDCAPENFPRLDEVQRSRCRSLGAFSSYDPSAMDWADHSDRMPGAKRWERELARKKAPLLLPCGNAKAFDFVYTGGCIIANIANGFTFKKQYENQPAYFDKSGKSQ